MNLYIISDLWSIEFTNSHHCLSTSTFLVVTWRDALIVSFIWSIHIFVSLPWSSTPFTLLWSVSFSRLSCFLKNYIVLSLTMAGSHFWILSCSIIEVLVLLSSPRMQHSLPTSQFKSVNILFVLDIYCPWFTATEQNQMMLCVFAQFCQMTLSFSINKSSYDFVLTSAWNWDIQIDSYSSDPSYAC